MNHLSRSRASALLATALLLSSFLALRARADGDSKPQPKVSEAAKQLSAANNTFGIKLFKQLHQDGKNIFISPACIAGAMQMAEQGAGGDTKAEMDDAMGLKGLDVKQGNKDLLAALNGRDGVKLMMANSLWADPKRMSLNQAYVKDMQEYFDAAVRAPDFKDPSTVGEINGWISGKTNDLIKDMLKKIPPDAVTYLINAIYFKGDWTVKFKKDETRDADFHTTPDAEALQVKMMSRHGEHIRYGEDDRVQVVGLPYGKDEPCTMWVVLPKKDVSLDSVIEGIDAAGLKAWQDRTREREGTIKLPRFKLHYKATLNEALKALGIKKAFETTGADFTRMGESSLGNVSISSVLHEAVVIVNEEGTEAAAATVVEMHAESVGPPPFSMVCDHPFLFFITDKDSGGMLFMGACCKPQSAD